MANYIYEKCCKKCGAIFLAGVDSQQYCSKECYLEDRFGKLIKVECKHCGKEISFREDVNKKSKRKFCSKSCSAKFNNKIYRKKREKFCKRDGCDKVLLNRQSEYCSRECSGLAKKEKNIEKWLNGKTNGYLKTGTTKPFVREYIKNRDNRSCVLCGQGEIWNGKPLTLEVDHVDGNWKNDLPENLRTLCPNCHTQTNTYGSKNKTGNGRSHKRR